MVQKSSVEKTPEATPSKKPAASKATGATKKGSKPTSKKVVEATQKAADAAIVSMTKAPALKTSKSSASKSSSAKMPRVPKTKSAPIAKENKVTAKAPQQTPAPTPVATAKIVTPAPTPAPAPVATSSTPQQASPVVRQSEHTIQVRRESFRPNRPSAGQQQYTESHKSDDFAQAQPETFGGGDNDNFNKRNKRRRNRNKQQRGNQDERTPQQGFAFAPDRPKDLDFKDLSKRAWKIFLGEVTEEGIALMDDNTSRETAKRAFRIAEFFIIEENRRKQASKAPLKDQRSAEQSADEETEQDSSSENA
ncbi:MAG: hypothetical protein RSA21_03075 [Akkermansia sp.]